MRRIKNDLAYVTETVLVMTKQSNKSTRCEMIHTLLTPVNVQVK